MNIVFFVLKLNAGAAVNLLNGATEKLRSNQRISSLYDQKLAYLTAFLGKAAASVKERQESLERFKVKLVTAEQRMNNSR